MADLLIRSGKDPFTPVSAEASLTQDVINSNVGNYLFAHTVHRSLSVPGRTITSNGTLSERSPATAEDHARVNDRFEHFVVPLANAFRPDFVPRLQNLTTLVEGLDIPVTVVGVGAQAPIASDPSSLGDIAPPVRAFVGAVLDRSASIGVRGEFTRDYLLGLGFPDGSVDVIGCPSVLMNGPGHRVEKPLTSLGPDADVAVNLTPGVPGLGDLLTRHLERYPQTTYLGQDSHDLALLLWGRERPSLDPQLPVHLDHPLYRDHKMLLFLDIWPWIDHLRSKDFAFGTRFHGNVTALLAGVPAMLLAHDSRTLELARYHAMPYLPMAEVVRHGWDASDLLERTDLTEFNDVMAKRFETYVAFLERNDLAHVHERPEQERAFDDALAEVTFPGPVRPLTSPEGRELAGRLQWIREGQPFDATRHDRALQYPFPHPARRDAGVAKAEQDTTTKQELASLRAGDTIHTRELDELRTAVDDLRLRLVHLEATLTVQTSTSVRLRRRIEVLESRLDERAGPTLTRVRRRVRRALKR